MVLTLWTRSAPDKMAWGEWGLKTPNPPRVRGVQSVSAVIRQVSGVTEATWSRAMA